jgi:hypothetical protein
MKYDLDRVAFNTCILCIYKLNSRNWVVIKERDYYYFYMHNYNKNNIRLLLTFTQTLKKLNE